MKFSAIRATNGVTTKPRNTSLVCSPLSTGLLRMVSYQNPSLPRSGSMGFCFAMSTISSIGATFQMATSALQPSCTSACIRLIAFGRISVWARRPQHKVANQDVWSPLAYVLARAREARITGLLCQGRQVHHLERRAASAGGVTWH